MQAELRALSSSDVSDLTSYAPNDPFCLAMRALIGPKGLEGEESFDFEVCSPGWLAAELRREPVVSGRSRLVMAAFDVGAIEAYVRTQIAFATGDSWSEIANKLGRSFRWEFEDYAEARPVRP